MLTNNNDTAKKIKNFDENYSRWLIFDRIKQFFGMAAAPCGRDYAESKPDWRAI